MQSRLPRSQAGGGFALHEGAGMATVTVTLTLPASSALLKPGALTFEQVILVGRVVDEGSATHFSIPFDTVPASAVKISR